MTNKRDIEKEIREHWFKNNKATLTECGDLKILIWRQPDTICYYCRYVFVGRYLWFLLLLTISFILFLAGGNWRRRKTT